MLEKSTIELTQHRPKRTICTLRSRSRVQTLAVLASVFLMTTAYAHAEPRLEIKQELQAMVEEVRASSGIPSLACAVVIDDEIVVATTGIGCPEKRDQVSPDSLYQLGSVSKSMTGCVAAQLVKEGKIRWETSIGEVFPSLAGRSVYSSVTLAQLCTHRSGFPKDLNLKYPGYTTNRAPTSDERTQYLKAALELKPQAAGRWLYSNVGFVVTAIMLEAVSGRSWEQLLQQYVFNVTQMNSAKVGFQAATDPRPHRWRNKEPQASPYGYGNPRFLDGADQVRCSVGDLAKYAQAYFPDGPFYQDFKDGYDQGWYVTKGSQTKIHHDGTNRYNYCYVQIGVTQRWAVIVATNIGFDEKESGRRSERTLLETARRAKTIIRQQATEAPAPSPSAEIDR